MICRSIMIAASAIILLALMPEPVFASGSMRCGSHIITAGQRHGPSQYEVLKKCGEPTERNGYTWIYDRGSKQYFVLFDQSGRLERIE